MKVISQITPWPIMQAVKAQSTKNKKDKEDAPQVEKRPYDDKGEGTFKNTQDTTEEHTKIMIMKEMDILP